jgi:hypothetical protein
MNGLLLAAYVENITTRKDKTIKLTLGTQEMSPAVAGEVFRLLNQLTACYISPKAIGQMEIDQVDKVDPEISGKSQSQRIRNVLYRCWEQDNEGYKEFNNYYQFKTDAIVDHYKAKLQ